MKEQFFNNLDIVFTTNEIKDFYNKNKMNVASANYFIRNQIEQKNIEKIQNGLYLKNVKSINDNDIDIDLLFKNKNENEFDIINYKKFSSWRISNNNLNKNFVFVISRFYENNINIFNYIKKNKLAEVHILSSKWNLDVPIDNYSKVFALKYANIEDDEYKMNAFKLISEIKGTKISRILNKLKMTDTEQDEILGVYYGSK